MIVIAILLLIPQGAVEIHKKKNSSPTNALRTCWMSYGIDALTRSRRRLGPGFETLLLDMTMSGDEPARADGAKGSRSLLARADDEHGAWQPLDEEEHLAGGARKRERGATAASSKLRPGEAGSAPAGDFEPPKGAFEASVRRWP